LLEKKLRLIPAEGEGKRKRSWKKKEQPLPILTSEKKKGNALSFSGTKKGGDHPKGKIAFYTQNLLKKGKLFF